jgi:hypothetical protein
MEQLDMETVLFGEPARTGVVLTSGGADMVAVWWYDSWRKSGNPWRLIREIPWPLKIVGLGLLIGDEGFGGYVN